MPIQTPFQNNCGYSLFFAMILCVMTSIVSLSLYQHYFLSNITTQNLYHYHELLCYAENTLEIAVKALRQLPEEELLAEAGMQCHKKPCIISLQDNNVFFTQPVSEWEKNGSRIHQVNYEQGVKGFYTIEKITRQSPYFFRVTVLVKDAQNRKRVVQEVISVSRAGESERESWVSG